MFGERVDTVAALIDAHHGSALPECAPHADPGIAGRRSPARFVICWILP
jgi:hypothetical protein